MVEPNEADQVVRPLRIITESNSLDIKGGIELCTLQDSVALARRGHTLDLMYGADGDFRSRFEEAGIGLKGPVSFNVDIHRPFRGLAQLVGPTRWVRSKDPDVLWIQRFEHIIWAQTVSKLSTCPIVCHLHHKPNFNRTRLLGRGVAHFIAVSTFMRDVWTEAGLDPERISVISNALPHGEYPRGGVSELVSAREQLGIPVDARVVLYYGHISEQKGVGTLLEAWARIGSIRGNALLVVVGSPSPSSVSGIDRKLRDLNPAGVRLYPMQTDVIPFLHAADLVVAPSWLDEAFGRVVIEGMATGRPVIATRVGGVPEILSGSMGRFLVEPRNPDELCARIKSLIDWREAESGLGNACADWIDVRYPYEEHVTALEGVLLEYRRCR